MVRAEFNAQKPLKPDILKIISAIPDKKNVFLTLATEPAVRLKLAELQSQADGYVINSPAFRTELGSWLLPNDSKSGVGIPGSGFGLKDEQAIRLHRGLLGTEPLQPEDGLTFALGGKIMMEKTPSIGLLSVHADRPDFWLEAGRIAERIFLILEIAGVSVSIHAAIVEVALINSVFRVLFPSKNRLVFVFRAGYVSDKKYLNRPPSPRLPIDEVMLN